MLKKTYIKLFDIIDDYRPNDKNTKWNKNICNELNVKFEFNKLNFDELQKCYNSYNCNQDIEIGNIYIMYVLSDGKKQIVTCSIKDIRTYVMNLVYLWLKDKKKSILNKFDNIYNVVITIHSVYKNISYDEIIKTKNNLIEEFDKINLDNKKTDNIKNNIEYLKRLVTEEKERKLNTYYIYKFFGSDDKDIYIFYGEKKKCSTKEIFKLFDDYDFKCKKYKIELIEEIKCSTVLELNLTLDLYITKYNSCVDGLNIYNVGKYINNEMIFRLLQNELMINDIYIDSAYVAYIDYDNKKYVYSGYKNNLYDHIKYLYMMVIPKYKYNKIHKILSSVPFSKLKIKVIYQNINKNERKIYELIAIRQFNSIYEGYNDVHKK
jgi:hypothetical protein